MPTTSDWLIRSAEWLDHHLPALFGLLIAGALLWVARLEYRKSGQEEQNAHAREERAHRPFVVRHHKPNPNEAEHRAEEQAYWRWQRQVEQQKDKIVRLTFLLSIFAVIAAFLSFLEGRVQAGAAQGQLAELRDEQKAWIEITTESWAVPLTISATEITAQFQIKVKNVGHSLATNIWGYGEGFPWIVKPSPLALQEAVCKIRKRLPFDVDGVGVSAFPDQPNAVLIPIKTEKAIFDWAIDQNKGTPGFQPGKFSIYIVGCIEYKTLGREGWSHTPFIYEIDKRKGDGLFGWEHFTWNPQVFQPQDLEVLVNPRAQGQVD